MKVATEDACIIKDKWEERKTRSATLRSRSDSQNVSIIKDHFGVRVPVLVDYSESWSAPLLLRNANEGSCVVCFLRSVCTDKCNSFSAVEDGRRRISAQLIYLSGICFMISAYVAWRRLQVANCGGPMMTQDSWEQLPRETAGTWPSWGTRPAVWFTWKCTTERLRKVILGLYLPPQKHTHWLAAPIDS